MTFRLSFLFLFISVLSAFSTVSAQTDSVIGQVTNSTSEAFAGGMSGDGRLIVFESRGNIATENPRNADGNNEIFLFDYAQRRIYQITDTKSVLYDTALPATFDNVRIEISNTKPVISNDGKWIAFSSNATAAYPGTGASDPPVISSTNPGSFDGNTLTAPTPTPSPSPAATPTPGANPLTKDANLEMWLYRVPALLPVADLSAGDEIPATDLSGGLFIRVTNTLPSQLPLGGSTTASPIIADDNHDASISDDGHAIAFVSSRDLVPGVGNAFPAEDTEEIYTYVRDPATLGDANGGIGTLNQVTKTPRGTIADPIYNKLPTISGSGLRVAFASTGDGPIVGMPTGGNPSTSRNEEIFYSDLTAAGVPTGTKKQVTTTSPTNAGDPVNILNTGRRMSRDGRYIAFDSYADLANENSGTNYTSFATYVYDATTNTFRRILARSDADSAATGGDVARYPGFTDTDANGTPSTLVLETRLNIKSDGTVASVATDGLNNTTERQSQLYSFNLAAPAATATFSRLTELPVPNSFLASTQLITSNSRKRMSFSLALSELGLGNSDLQSEVYYMLVPAVNANSTISASYATGASNRPVSMSPVPTPSPTATPTPTPTPTGSPSPTPTPISPSAVYGLAPGMIAIMNFQSGIDRPVAERSAVGSLNRAFNLPIELSGISLTINGAACGLRYVNGHRIEFVLPPAIPSAVDGTSYSLKLFNNGVEMKTSVIVVPAQPDIFRMDGIIASGGRTKVFNVTNRVRTTEPFTVTTAQIKPFGRVATVLRLYLTGAANSLTNNTAIRIGRFGDVTRPSITNAVQVEPGVYTIDFTLAPIMNGAGDQPIILTISINGVNYVSRLDDTATQFRIL